MPRRPNILFLMSDEHRADVSGFAGDPVIRTPTLDWLAEGGVVFNNAYTPSPICVPARQCTLAGQFPKTCGCEGWIGLPSGHLTYPAQLGRYGYQTTAFGKLHLQGPDQLKGWQQRPVGDVGYGYGNERLEAIDKTPPEDDPLNVPGMSKWSDEKELRRAGPGPVHPTDALTIAGVQNWLDARFLGTWYDRHNPQQPLLLYVGLHDPHYPYTCREDLFRYYLPRVRGYQIETPFDHPFLGLSPWPPTPLQAGVDVPQRVVQRARAAYYGKVETMDMHYGQVLDTLRQAGEDLDDWIIIYCSDHGDQLGEHGVWEKQKFFEGSVRVPLIIRAPRLLPAGTRVDANVNLCDLFATLCHLVDVPVPAGLDSRSLQALMTQETVNWSDETCSFFLQQGFQNVMIKRGDLKYQWYFHETRGPLGEVLFDLTADPLETKNHLSAPQYRQDLAAFRHRLTELGYGPAV